MMFSRTKSLPTHRAIALFALLLFSVVLTGVPAADADAAEALQPPEWVSATVEQGDVTITWERVDDAGFYFLRWTKPGGDEARRYQWVGQNADPTITYKVPAAEINSSKPVAVQSREKTLGVVTRSSWKEADIFDGSATGAATLCRRGQSIGDRLGVERYAETRVPLESHVWFFPTDRDSGGADTGHSFGHGHMLTCVPLPTAQGGAPLTSRELELDIEIQAHLGAARDLKNDLMPSPADDVRVIVREIEIRGVNGPGRDRLVDRVFADDLYDCDGSKLALETADDLEDACAFINCTRPAAPAEGHLGHGDCISSVSLRGSNAIQLNGSERLTALGLDNTGLDRNGKKQLRIAAIHEIYVGTELVAEMRAIGRAPFDLDIDDGRGNINADAERFVTETSGWLVEESRNGAGGYASVGLEWPDADDAANSALSPIRSVPQGESFTIDATFQADSCLRNCANERVPLKNYAVYMDADFHTSGWVQGRLDNEHSFGTGWGGTDILENIEVSTAGLEAGPHWLLLATEQPMVDGLACTNPRTRGCKFAEDGQWIVPADWSSTLTGLQVVHFVVTPAAD